MITFKGNTLTFPVWDGTSRYIDLYTLIDNAIHRPVEYRVTGNTWEDIALNYYTGFHLYLRAPDVSTFVEHNTYDNYTSNDQLMQLSIAQTVTLTNNTFKNTKTPSYTFMRVDEAQACVIDGFTFENITDVTDNLRNTLISSFMDKGATMTISNIVVRNS